MAHHGTGAGRRASRALGRDVLRAGALVALTVALWCVVYGRTNLEAWRVPVDYVGDSLGHSLAYLKAAKDGHVSPLGLLMVPELNAPFEASWNDFPRQHKLQFWAAGWLARWLGLFPTANLLLLLAHVLAGLSFYAVARYFRARWEWALAGAAAFAFSPYLLYRSLAHLNLSFDWPIPLAVLVVTWCTGRAGLRPGSPRFWFALAVAAVTGLHHVYYVGFFAQFLVLGSLVQWLRRAGRAAIVSPVLLLAVLLLSAAADNASTFAYAWQHGSNPASVVRPYGNLERFALKPLELLLPREGSGLVPWRSASAAYYRGALYRGEMGSAYLGLAGIAALAWLLAVSLRTSLPGKRRWPTTTGLALLWILAYAVVGGLNGLLGAFGLVWFRATNRFSIWILSLLLLWVVVRLSRAAWTRRRGASVVAAALATAVALVDQIPRPTPASGIGTLASHVASDRTLVRSLEAALPPGAMLFQLPVVDCPEGPQIGKMGPHDHFRPYLYSSRLRFSYGSDKGRPREAWQHRAETLQPEAMAEALERIGFGGLLVNRKAYADAGGELRARLAATGRQEAWESTDHEFLFIRLKPASVPALPDVVIPPGPLPAAAPS